MTNPKNRLPSKEKLSSSTNSYARYSNVAIQVVIIAVLGVFGGIQLDEWLVTQFPIFTVLCSMLAVGIAMYWLIQKLK